MAPCECGCGVEGKGRFRRGHNHRIPKPTPVLVDDPTSSVLPIPAPRIRTSTFKGRRVNERGYVVLYLPGHHLADSKGRVYEHRLVAEHKLGRRLLPTEDVHHINENKGDNRPENLEVFETRAAHLQDHWPDSRNRREGEENPTITCACGCGQTFLKYDSTRRPRMYLYGHQARARWGGPRLERRA